MRSRSVIKPEPASFNSPGNCFASKLFFFSLLLHTGGHEVFVRGVELLTLLSAEDALLARRSSDVDFPSDAAEGSDARVEDELVEHLAPRRVVGKVVVEVRRDFLHLKLHFLASAQLCTGGREVCE